MTATIYQMSEYRARVINLRPLAFCLFVFTLFIVLARFIRGV